jgi:hypothetical protein
MKMSRRKRNCKSPFLKTSGKDLLSRHSLLDKRPFKDMKGIVTKDFIGEKEYLQKVLNFTIQILNEHQLQS